MKLGLIPENMMDRIALWKNLGPTPLIESFMSLLIARSIMAATKLGLMKALSERSLTIDELSHQCQTDRFATAKLVNTLVSCNYVTQINGKYSISKSMQKWFAEGTDTDLTDNILFRYFEWDILSNCEEFIRTGKPVDVHSAITEDSDWQSYQKGMRSLAGLSAQEVATRTPVPDGATTMLDVGGSHGYYSVSLCRQYPELKATILDLPPAIKQAAPILQKENMGNRVVHQAGDVLVDDLGENRYDLVFISSLVHHFDDTTNFELAKKIARALKPNGAYVIMEMIRPESPETAGQPATLLDLYFAMISRSGTWSFDEMAAWQKAAGLKVQKPIWLRSNPGFGQQAGIKK